MARTSIRTLTFQSRKTRAANAAVARAKQIIRARSAGTLSAPLRTGGFFTTFQRFGGGGRELKFVDVDQTIANVRDGATPSIVLLNGVLQGDDFNERVGRRIHMKSWLIRFKIASLATATSPIGNTVRITVVLDLQTNGAAPLLTDVYTTNTTNLAPMNLNNRARFKILHDRVMTMPAAEYSAGALTAGSPVPKVFKLYKRFNTTTTFGATGGTVAAIQSGSIFCIVWGENDAVSTFEYQSRIRFTDP